MTAGHTEAAVTGWQAVTAALSDYASKARQIGGDIGQSLVGAFQSAENAVGEFVKTGKLNFRDLVTSLLADLAARRFILPSIQTLRESPARTIQVSEQSKNNTVFRHGLLD